MLVLTELIENHNDATLDELRYLLYQKIGVTISRATMGRMTQHLKMTLKKTLFPSDKGSERVLNQLYEFWLLIKGISFKDLIFIDETGIYLAMLRLYARSLKGSRARGEKPNKRGKNVSDMVALSTKKILTSVNLLGAIDAITFEAFVMRKLVPLLLRWCLCSDG